MINRKILLLSIFVWINALQAAQKSPITQAPIECFNMHLHLQISHHKSSNQGRLTRGLFATLKIAHQHLDAAIVGKEVSSQQRGSKDDSENPKDPSKEKQLTDQEKMLHKIQKDTTQNAHTIISQMIASLRSDQKNRAHIHAVAMHKHLNSVLEAEQGKQDRERERQRIKPEDKKTIESILQDANTYKQRVVESTQSHVKSKAIQWPSEPLPDEPAPPARVSRPVHKPRSGQIVDARSNQNSSQQVIEKNSQSELAAVIAKPIPSAKWDDDFRPYRDEDDFDEVEGAVEL